MIPFLLCIGTLILIMYFVFSSSSNKPKAKFDAEYARKWNIENEREIDLKNEKLDKLKKAVDNHFLTDSKEPVVFEIKDLPDDFDAVEYTAFDFETGNRNPLSAISLGIAHFKGNQLLEMHEFRFSPYDQEDFVFTQLHGIKKEDVAGLPSFEEQFENIFPHLNSRQLVAHNADFDVDVLKNLLTVINKRFHKNRISCTYRLAKRFVKYERSYSLENLCRNLRIPYWNHKAAYDAVSAGVLFMHCLAVSSGGSVTEGAMRGKAVALKPIVIKEQSN